MESNTEFYATIPVQDLDRAKEFYTSMLGLRVMAGGMPGIAFLENDTHTKLMLFQRPPATADHALAGFVVENMEAAVDELVAKGVHFEQYDMGNGMKTDERGILTAGPSKAAWFRDTENNILSLHGKV